MFKLNKNNIIKILGILTFSIVLYWTLENFSNVGGFFSILITLITPFLLGIAIAFILNVPINFLENKVFISKKFRNSKLKRRSNNKLKRIISIIISLALMFGIIFFVLFLVIPELILTISSFKNAIPFISENFNNLFNYLTAKFPELQSSIDSFEFNLNNIDKDMFSAIQSGLTGVLASSISFVGSLFSGIINFVIGLVFAVYLLFQKEKLAKQVKKLIFAYLPEDKVNKILHITDVSNKTFSNFIAGQFTESIILGVLCFIGMLILQIPYALTISVLIAFTSLIPIVGAFIGVGIGIILIIVSNPIQALIFLIFILILQQIEGNLIYPKVVGDSVGLPGIWVLVAITIGGSLGGIIGIVLSVPICSILYSLLREDVNERLEKKKIICQ